MPGRSRTGSRWGAHRRGRWFPAVFALAVLAAATSAPAAGRPQLVLFITVDALRGDMPARYADRFGPGGLRYLLERGVHYTNAHYSHATTFTASGHATLFTGGNPPEHGLPANDWVGPDGQRVYCVEDDRHTVLGERTRPHQGTSPRNLTSGTIGDELVASGGGSRVFSVSIKDRGAIIPGGFLGKAFWYSGATGRFVTSTYYYTSEPQWVRDWNDAGPAGAWRGGQWRLLRDPASYTHAADDDRPFETSWGSLGRVFPHPLADDDRYYSTLRFTPMGDELTVSFVEELVRRERVGGGAATDLLAVSLSSTDYVTHVFGLYSLEAEDNLLRLDRAIARLLEIVDEAVGLDRTLIVLSSDHGADAAPEHWCRLRAGGAALPVPGGLLLDPDGCGLAGRHDPGRLIAAANTALRRRFNVEADLVLDFWNPSLFLDSPRIEALELDEAEVERALARFVAGTPGIAQAFTRSDLLAGRVPDTPLAARVKRAFHPQRSGNVIIVQAPFWFLHREPTLYTSMHGSPYAYDTHVPIIIAGPGIEPAVVNRGAGPEDIAPTLALYLGIECPPASVGEPLLEAIR